MKQFVTTALASLLLLLGGCTTPPITDYRPGLPAASERMIQQSGVEIALDPFVERERTKQYFDIDAIADGIGILHARVANKTADQTFLVEKKHFQLLANGTAGGWIGDGKKLERDQSAGTATELAGAVAGGLGGAGLMLAGLALTSKATEIQRNFTSKEMGDQTLSPGQIMEGFVYFAPVTKGQDWTRTGVVKVDLTETKTQQTITLQIPLSH
jgi:hypothetical protein